MGELLLDRKALPFGVVPSVVCFFSSSDEAGFTALDETGSGVAVGLYSSGEDLAQLSPA